MSNQRIIGPGNIRLILADLAAELRTSGAPIRLYLIGGAAISLIHLERGLTTDVDGWFNIEVDFAHAVEVVGAKWKLDPGWFNDKARNFTPAILFADEVWECVHHLENVEIYIARADVLLAMKLKARRPKDQPDIDFLVRHLGITSVDQADAIMEKCFPGDLLDEKAIARVLQAIRSAESQAN